MTMGSLLAGRPMLSSHREAQRCPRKGGPQKPSHRQVDRDQLEDNLDRLDSIHQEAIVQKGGTIPCPG